MAVVGLRGLSGWAVPPQRVAAVGVEFIADGDDIDRLIDTLEPITGQRPANYERRVTSEPASLPPAAVEPALFTASTEDEMIGEVVE